MNGSRESNARDDFSHLQQGMRVEFVEEVHDRVCLERSAADHYVLLALGSVRRVRAAELLPFHPRVRQLLELQNHRGVRAF